METNTLYVQQMYTGCLAQAAYYVESNGEAAIIDPMRESEPYIQLAAERGAKIKYVLETHFHADFVSGHIDLAQAVGGATIVYGPGASAAYDIHVAQDGERIQLGQITLEVLHTPGHTPESCCYLLRDETDQPVAIFTGDTLFVGDVGRPDLAVKSDLTEADLAAMLYDSLHHKILTLPDHVVVYPGHGPGSQCGKQLGDETESTIGEQRRSNYALQPMDKATFVETVTQGLLPPPQYFFQAAAINKSGYGALDKVMETNLHGLSPEEVTEWVRNGAMVLDTRHPEQFAQGHIPGAINIGLDGSFAVWVGTLLDNKVPMVVVTEAGREQEALLRLARVGYTEVRGFLKDGMGAWTAAKLPTAQVKSIDPAEFVRQVLPNNPTVLDVRKLSEYENGHLAIAQNVPLADFGTQLAKADIKQPVYVHCAGGYRSVIACSWLMRQGVREVVNIIGGMSALQAANAPLVVSQPALA